MWIQPADMNNIRCMQLLLYAIRVEGMDEHIFCINNIKFQLTIHNFTILAQESNVN